MEIYYMRSILVSIMLLIVIIVLYEHTIGGEDGTLQDLQIRGNQVNVEIERIDPWLNETNTRIYIILSLTLLVYVLADL